MRKVSQIVNNYPDSRKKTIRTSAYVADITIGGLEE